MSSSLQEIPLDKKVGPGTQKENKKVYAHVCVCVFVRVCIQERERVREKVEIRCACHQEISCHNCSIKDKNTFFPKIFSLVSQ